jgi:hypothetical protein
MGRTEGRLRRSNQQYQSVISIRSLDIAARCSVRLCFGHRFVGNSVSSLRTDVAKPQIRELCVCLISQPTNAGKPLGQFIAGVGECAFRRDFVESSDIEVPIRPILKSMKNAFDAI